MSAMDSSVSVAADEVMPRTPGQAMRHRALRHPGFLIGSGIVILLVLIAVFAPLLAPHDPFEQALSARMAPPVWNQGGSWDHLLGTDQNGRDYLSRLIYGARISIGIGLGAAAIGLLIGVTLGVIAGYFGGWVDHAVSFLLTAQLALPGLLLAMALVFIIGPSIWVVIGIIGVLHWTYYLVVTRSATQRLRSLDFVAGGPGRRRQPAADPVARGAAEPGQPDHRHLHLRTRHRHPRRGLAVVPRRRHPAADAMLGADDRRGQAGDVLPAMAGGSARPLPVRAGDRRQPDGRRAARHHLARGEGLMLLDIDDLSVEIGRPGEALKVVRGVSLSLDRGEVLGMVGESGSGKSITALALMRLLPRGGRIAGGRLRLDGEDLAGAARHRLLASDPRPADRR